MGWWFRRRGEPGDRPERGRVRPRFGSTAADLDELEELARQARPREMADAWFRALTLMGEPGLSLQQKVDMIAEVNQPARVSLRIDTPLPRRDANVLRAATEWESLLRSRQAWINMGIENLLIEWLSEATGQSRGEIIQRLALTVDPEPPRADSSGSSDLGDVDDGG